MTLSVFFVAAALLAVGPSTAKTQPPTAKPADASRDIVFHKEGRTASTPASA